MAPSVCDITFDIGDTVFQLIPHCPPFLGPPSPSLSPAHFKKKGCFSHFFFLLRLPYSLVASVPVTEEVASVTECTTEVDLYKNTNFVTSPVFLTRHLCASLTLDTRK